jgi:hypothetical protein
MMDVDDDKLSHATQDVNQFTCTNLNFVDYSKERGRSASLLPVVCENGMTAAELNDPITKLADSITSTSFISKKPPYYMTNEAFVENFDGYFNKEDDNDEYFTFQDMIKAMIPGQHGLVTNIKKLIRQYNVSSDKLDLTKLTNAYCEANPCKASFFIKMADGEDRPQFPKLRSPRTYRITEEMFKKRALGQKYLCDLKASLDQEETRQCLVCDAINYYQNGYNGRFKFSMLGVPVTHGTFYKSAANHALLIDKKDGLFNNIILRRNHHNGTYYIIYKDKWYE